MMSWQRKLGLGATAALCVAGLWAYYPALTHPKVNLAFKVEGALDSKLNYRDAGRSINECLGSPVLPEGKLLRSSGFFSGWSCDRVGNPDVLYSLNYSQAEDKRFYCRGSDGIRIGTSFQVEEISDIEFLENWDLKPEQTRNVCAFIREGWKIFEAGKSMLYHCEAGRDRTGAVIAIMAAYYFEGLGPLTDAQIDAIECDYRKSKSLKSEKYGRISKMLYEMRSQGGVRSYLDRFCR